MSPTYAMIQAWNTGRHYTAAGQRVAAGYTTEGDVYFYDVDRMVCGKLLRPISFVELDVMGSSVQEYVMAQYDASNYEDQRYEGCSLSEVESLGHVARQV